MSSPLHGDTVVDVMDSLPPGTKLERISNGEGQMMSWVLTLPDERVFQYMGLLDQLIAYFLVMTMEQYQPERIDA